VYFHLVDYRIFWYITPWPPQKSKTSLHRVAQRKLNATDADFARNPNSTPTKLWIRYGPCIKIGLIDWTRNQRRHEIFARLSFINCTVMQQVQNPNVIRQAPNTIFYPEVSFRHIVGPRSIVCFPHTGWACHIRVLGQAMLQSRNTLSGDCDVVR